MTTVETKNGVTTTSKFLSIDWMDTLKALIIAVGTPVIVIIQKAALAYLNNTPFVLNWKTLLAAGIGGGSAYLLKNFLTSSKTVTPAEPS